MDARRPRLPAQSLRSVPVVGERARRTSPVALARNCARNAGGMALADPGVVGRTGDETRTSPMAGGIPVSDDLARLRGSSPSSASPGRSDPRVALGRPGKPGRVAAARRGATGQSFAIRRRSSLRDVTSSLVNTLWRCHSTVRGLKNIWAPISGFVIPSQARSTICLSWGLALRPSSASASERFPPSRAARGARARRTRRRRCARKRCEHAAVAHGRRRSGVCGAAIRRRGAGLGRGERQCACGPAARSLPGTWPRLLAPG
jgi:hypothetical protein